MEIKCTVEELKELINNKTPVAGTTDVITNHYINNEKISSTVEPLKQSNFIKKIAKNLDEK